MKDEEIARLCKQINAWNEAKLNKQVAASNKVESVITNAQNGRVIEKLK